MRAVPGDPLLEPGQTARRWIQQQLNVSKLNKVHRHLWFAGRQGNIRQLHAQRMLGRHIVVTERADMHLVWHDSIIFMKPLPDCLLNWGFWSQHICAGDTEDEEKKGQQEVEEEEVETDGGRNNGNTRDLYPDACGFLYTYTKLIRSVNDLEVARASGLISRSVEWSSWAAFVRRFQKANIDPFCYPKSLNRRWWYGELRLNRLDIIYRLMMRQMRGYHYRCRRYKNFLEGNFAWVAVVLGYAVTILTAMQVVLTLPSNQVPQSFATASWGFSVACIIASMLLLFVILVFTLLLIVTNVTITLRNEKKMESQRGKGAC
ncbi:hypothetical protein GP486_007073 [Trichoglossum hirsutum]|uniref:Uncharacterized protein n=1 Tax=Trichoglossum hirsutum TaxID=265104 RepID=A0A9P8IJQ5_9PEZI|nr:hypothetical protein GP486_007073 [Trichoglossum hirsutum]